MEKEKLLISRCLLGDLVKYNGGHNGLDENILNQLKKKYELYPVCPEVEGGLETPRIPCEIISYEPIKVINKEGANKSKSFIKGAQIALEIVKKNNIKKALLKANSPSCSNMYVYDGTFSKKIVKNFGITVKILQNEDIRIFNETQIEYIL